MEFQDKYKSIKTETLIRGVQEMAQRVEKAKDDGMIRTVSMQRTARELVRTQSEAISRLKQMDRLSPGFFPDNVLVEYKNRSLQDDSLTFEERDLGPPTRNGKVIGRTQGKLLVQLDGDQYPIEVDPVKLKIRYLRTIFI